MLWTVSDITWDTNRAMIPPPAKPGRFSWEMLVEMLHSCNDSQLPALSTEESIDPFYTPSGGLHPGYPHVLLPSGGAGALRRRTYGYPPAGRRLQAYGNL
jgi:hypothetical protein